MTLKSSYTPEDKEKLLNALQTEIKTFIDPINAAFDEIWKIAAKEKVWLINFNTFNYPFTIWYPDMDTPPNQWININWAEIFYPWRYGYFESNKYNGDVRYSPIAPALRVDANGNLFSGFNKTNLPGKAQFFDTAVSAFRGNGGVWLKNQIITDSGTSQFWQKIFAVNGPYDRSFGKVAEIGNLRTKIAALTAAKVVDFGFRIYKKNQVIYNSSSITWNQVDMFLVPANNAVNRNYSFLAGRNVKATQMFINPPPVDQKAVAHTIWIGNDANGAGVSVYGGNQDVYIMVLMQ